MSYLLYGNESWTISPQIKRKLEPMWGCKMWFKRKMFRITLMEHVYKKEVLRKIGMKRTLGHSQNESIEISGMHE